jgi:hypothetical protein
MATADRAAVSQADQVSVLGRKFIEVFSSVLDSLSGIQQGATE